MTPSKELQSAREYISDIQKKTDRIASLITPIAEVDFPTLNFYCGSCWIWCNTREQLITALSIAPGKWDKTPSSNGFEYRQFIDDLAVVVCSSGDALPATCRVVEEEITEPILVPSGETTTRKVTRIVCDKESLNVPEQTV